MEKINNIEVTDSNNNNIEEASNSKKMSSLEKMTLEILIKLFPNYIFDRNIRPNFMKNDLTGRNLELDFYSEKLELAIECQGKQHVEGIPFFHGKGETGDKNFAGQVQRDEDKIKLCAKKGINLVLVYYNESYEEIHNKIKNSIYIKSEESKESEESKNEYYNQQIKKKNNPKKFVCGRCGKQFARKEHLQYHEKKACKGGNEENILFKIENLEKYIKSVEDRFNNKINCLKSIIEIQENIIEDLKNNMDLMRMI